jgi:hypothetical protein
MYNIHKTTITQRIHQQQLHDFSGTIESQQKPLGIRKMNHTAKINSKRFHPII